MPLSDTSVLEQMQSKRIVSAPVSMRFPAENQRVPFKRGEQDLRNLGTSGKDSGVRDRSQKSHIFAGADGVMPYLLVICG
ncbi:hypothetical protein PCE1_003984 [Barthelona sp. PCE]